MFKTTYRISKMDCPSEENLIRMKLQDIQNLEELEFDLEKRILTVFHQGGSDRITAAIQELNLGDKKLGTEEGAFEVRAAHSDQKNVLITVLLINAVFFIIEMTTGILSGSMGLIADSLDMLADSFVYGISLIAVGGTITRKKKIASIAGYAQLTLAVLGFAEVIRRFTGSAETPDYKIMIIVSVFALMANGICLYLLQKSKSREEAHMKASMIFTSNDVVINLGVIIAGLLVMWLGSNLPDLIIGTTVFIVVIQGAFRILRLGK